MASVDFNKPGSEYIREPNIRIYSDQSSKTTYTFEAYRQSNNNYASFLMFGSTSGGNGFFMYLGFVNTVSNGNTVSLHGIVPHAEKTFTVTYDNSTLTITADSTVWGGIRLLWMA